MRGVINWSAHRRLHRSSAASVLPLLMGTFAACTGSAGQTASLEASQPEWWRSGVCYEVFVRSFVDSDGDGTGDLRGLVDRLDHINDGDAATDDDLGANCVWLMPIMQSPTYHGYDVTNYYDINRDYGTLGDFRAFVAAAHERGIHVIIDLVLNHVSSEHPYFVDALLDAESPYRDWFIWAPQPRPAPGWTAPVWHRVPGRDEYYYGLFWSGMPDYDLDNPAVKAELERIARFWLTDVGVDGFRMDAVGHFFESPDGGWKHGPGTHPWLREFAGTVESIRPGAFMIGEVWDSIREILPYYPDQLTAYFMFEIADGVIEAVRTGSPTRLVTAVEHLEAEVPGHRWGVFLRNHDQTRTLTELEGDVARARLAASIMLTLPGIPFVYYGEELGMTGSKSDGDPRLRTPMAWTRGAGVGFTHGVPWHPLQPDSLTANVQAQDEDPTSLLNHYRRLIHLRSGSTALARGEFVPLQSADGTLAYLRHSGDDVALVVANLGESPLASVDVSAADVGLVDASLSATDMLDGAAVGAIRVEGGTLRGSVADVAPLSARVLRLQ